MASANANAHDAYDGIIINDQFELLEFVNWLRRSTRDTACVLLSQDAHGNPHVPLDQVRKTVSSRAVTVLLDNAVQQSARNQLGIVNPHHGAARVFPSGDAWCDDSIPCTVCSLRCRPTRSRCSAGCGSISCARAGAVTIPGVRMSTATPSTGAMCTASTVCTSRGTGRSASHSCR